MPWADRILILDQHNRRLDDEENHFLFPAALSVLCFYDSLFHLHYLSPSVCVQMWPSGLLEWSPRVMRVSDLINWDVRRAQFTLVAHQPTSQHVLLEKQKYFFGGVNISSMCVLIKGLRKSVLCGGFHAENLILVRWSSSQRGDNKTSSSSPLAQNLIVVIIMFIVIAKIR